MSPDESTQTTSVGSRDWIEASKNMEVRGYMPPMDTAEITTEQIEQDIQPTVTSYEVPAPVRERAILTTARTSTDS